MDDFLARAAALVRHTIHVLSTLAQIDVLPRRVLPHPIQRTIDPHTCAEELGVLQMIADKIGFSRHAQVLMCDLFLDYAQLDLAQAQTAEVLTATIFLYAEINNIDLTPITELYHVSARIKRRYAPHMTTCARRCIVCPMIPAILGRRAL